MQPVQPSEPNTSSSISGSSARLSAARYGIGAVVVLAAVVVLVVVPGDIGFTSAMAYGSASALGAALSLMLLNLLYRLCVRGDRERGQKEEARRYLDAYGVWPIDDEPQKHQLTHRCVVPRGAVPAEQEERGDRPARGERIRVPAPGER